jgi:murein DD-endopeptidase MepM/ murein hydrolase activator NlpD
MKMRYALLITLACLFFIVPVALPHTVHSQSVADLQAQIDANNSQIDAINKEIAQYQAQLTTTTAQKNTLQNKIKALDLQRKKLESSITVTQKQISTTQLQIAQLADGIATKQGQIETDRNGLAESIRRLYQAEQIPLAVTVLSSDNIAQAWQDTDNMASLQRSVSGGIEKLSEESQSLTETKQTAEDKKASLLKQQQTLATQQGSLNATRSAQATLLTQTKSQEATYQSILAQKKAQEQSFEATLKDLQSKLKSADNSTIPVAGSVLSWPLTNVRITQYFGDTAFSRTAAYKGNGHNGIDLGAAIGTPVLSALDGVVWDTNLGVAPNCQYGKWVLIKHADGLSTLYAHLSSIKVSAGQSVSTGDVLGYSGETGYATGPHLHFGVYNTSSISFINYKCNSGPTVRVPVSPFNGYLNPILYLPAV